MRRLYALLFAAGLLNLLWGAALIGFLRAGTVSPWLGWIVPLPLALGVFVSSWAFNRLVLEHR